MSNLTWCFQHLGKTPIVIKAIDGPTAWVRLAELVGEKQWHGGYEIPLPHGWSIYCVCDCGKTQGYRYCSLKCANLTGETG